MLEVSYLFFDFETILIVSNAASNFSRSFSSTSSSNTNNNLDYFVPIRSKKPLHHQHLLIRLELIIYHVQLEIRVASGVVGSISSFYLYTSFNIMCIVCIWFLNSRCTKMSQSNSSNSLFEIVSSNKFVTVPKLSRRSNK